MHGQAFSIKYFIPLLAAEWEDNMNKKLLKDLCKSGIVCAAAFTLLNARVINADAEELTASDLSEMQDCLSEASSKASKQEPYTVSVEAGNYTLNYEISVPSYTTLHFEKGTKINCKGNYAIRITSSDNATVDGGYFSGAGILVTGGSGTTIKNTTIDGAPEFGIAFKNDTGKNNLIQGNTVKNGAGRFSITLLGATYRGDIDGNTIQKAPDIAMYLYNSKMKGDITGNTIKNCKMSAFYAGITSIDGDIRNNTITNVKGNGIGIYHGSHVNAIDGNKLDGIGGKNSGFNGDNGIMINADEGPGKKATPTYAKCITNNIIKNVTYSGINMYSGPSGGKESNANQDKAYVKGDIKGNKIYNVGTYKHSKDWKKEIQKGGKIGTQNGIYVDTHARVYGDICENTVTKSNQHGIYIRVGSIVKNIYNNTITNVKEDGISVMKAKVTGTIKNNKITKAKRAGIYVREGATVNKVSGNKFKQVTFKDIATASDGKIKKNG